MGLSPRRLVLVAIVACTAAASIAPAWSQTAPPAQQPGFRDKDGRIWTPDNVGQPDSKPVAPEDRAFDPNRQVITRPGEVVDQPRHRVIGTVPILSGPNTSVPVVTLERPTLQLDRRVRWTADLVVANNSGRLIDVELLCRFFNGAQLVEEARFFLRGIEAGQKVESRARGPEGRLFVNTLTCQVLSPLQ